MNPIRKKIIKLAYKNPDIRPHLLATLGRSKTAAGESLFETIQEFCNELAKVSQKILRRETAVIAHRPGASCEAHVTHKADKTRYRICYGVDATDVENVKVVVQFKNGDEVMEELDLPGAMEPTDVADEACDRMLELIGLGSPKTARSLTADAEDQIDKFFKNWGYARTPAEGFAEWNGENPDALTRFDSMIPQLADDMMYAIQQDRTGLEDGVTEADMIAWLKYNKRALLKELSEYLEA